MTTLRRGLQLSKYKLANRIGLGSSAEVWKARDLIEDRWVALKIVELTGEDSDEDIYEEIRINVQLDHPNILRVRNAERAKGFLLLASDMAIESLDERMARRIATKKAVNFIGQIISGLAFAHEKRLIHRDIKPANVMIFPDDQLKVADFGIALLAPRTMISATGSGTILYSAPEQVHGYPCFASDVFSAGLVSYQLLTGKLPKWPFSWPFEGLSQLKKKVPSELIAIIEKATRFNHKQRYRDATEMLEAFREIEQPLLRHFSSGDPRKSRTPIGYWRQVRALEFEEQFKGDLVLSFSCPSCYSPVSENMHGCPWCGIEKLSFAESTSFPFFCTRCQHGLKEEWRFCPWCWGGSVQEDCGAVEPDTRYRGKCRSCTEPLMIGMKYCPWCHAKVEKPLKLPGADKSCSHCHGPVASEYWDFCPWCSKNLLNN